MEISQPPSIEIIKETTNPQLGMSYTLTCKIGTAGLSNRDIRWLNPNNKIIFSNSDLQVGNVKQEHGSSVRTLTFTKLSTANSGSYLCKSGTVAYSSSLITNGMTNFMQHWDTKLLIRI